MKSRKTFDVDKFKDYCNTALAQPGLTMLERRAVATVLEHVLHDSGNYKGFSYTGRRFVGEATDDSQRRYF